MNQTESIGGYASIALRISHWTQFIPMWSSVILIHPQSFDALKLTSSVDSMGTSLRILLFSFSLSDHLKSCFELKWTCHFYDFPRQNSLQPWASRFIFLFHGFVLLKYSTHDMCMLGKGANFSNSISHLEFIHFDLPFIPCANELDFDLLVNNIWNFMAVL